MAIQRVFVTRTYIVCEYFDIESDDLKSCAKEAVKAANKLYPDPRERAMDNGWIADKPVEIPELNFPHGVENCQLILETKKSKIYQLNRDWRNYCGVDFASND